MKDTEKNLNNNELNDNEMEAVAGGRWSPENLSALGDYRGWVQQHALKFNGPRQFVFSLMTNYKKGNPYYDGYRVKARNICHMIENFHLEGDDFEDFVKMYESQFK